MTSMHVPYTASRLFNIPLHRPRLLMTFCIVFVAYMVGGWATKGYQSINKYINYKQQRIRLYIYDLSKRERKNVGLYVHAGLSLAAV